MTLTLNGHEREKLFVDTMCDVSLISVDLLASIDPQKMLKLTKNQVPNLVSAGNERLQLEGAVAIPVTRGNVGFPHRFIVSAPLPKGIHCLLGNDILPQIGILKSINPIKIVRAVFISEN